MHSSPVRHSPPVRASSYCAAVRLACVRPTASVHSEPGSNSSLKITCPKATYFSCRCLTTGNVSLALNKLFHCLIKRLQDGQSSSCRRPHKIPAHTFKERGIGLSAFFPVPNVSVQRAAHYSDPFRFVNTSFRDPTPPLQPTRRHFVEASRLL